jgi:predicted nucleic acid-binding Zn finger protein
LGGGLEELTEILIESKGVLDAKLLEELSCRFGRSRVEKAIRTVMDGGVKLYVFKPSGRILWVIEGREKKRFILPASGYCSCEDFYFNVVDGKARLCYHVIAQRIASLCSRYDVVEARDDLYDEFTREFREMPMEGKPRYLDVAENIRAISFEILAEKGPQPTGVLYFLLSERGIDIPSKRSLSMILRMDPKNRFKFKSGKWILSEASRET